MDFPNIKPPIYPIKETIPDTAIKGKLENQVIIARKRFTRTPMSFELSWTALPEADYETLRAFNVRFDGDFSFSCTNHGYWEGGIKLTEA